jgi:transposase
MPPELGPAWGQVTDYTQYKALRAGKLVIKVAPQFSSQTCTESKETGQIIQIQTRVGTIRSRA